MRKRADLKTEIALAVMPAVTVTAVLMLLQAFSKQQLLFSSLASSAFLIYLDPRHPANRIRTIIIAQMSAAVIGYLIYLIARCRVSRRFHFYDYRYWGNDSC